MPARNRISLVGKTLRVLEVLAQSGRPIPLKELADQVELVKSSAYRILFTLKELGYVEQRETNGSYGLTWRMHSLLRRGAAQMTLLDLARPHMVKLRDEVQEVVWLAEWRQGAAVVVGGVDVTHRLRFSIDIGSPVGLHSTALGKAIAAHLPDKTITGVLGKGKLLASTPNTIIHRTHFRQELTQVRRIGYAINREESIEGLIAFAAPIFDARGGILASVSVGSPVFRCTPAVEKNLVEATKRTAKAITTDLESVQFESRNPQTPRIALAV